MTSHVQDQAVVSKLIRFFELHNSLNATGMFDDYDYNLLDTYEFDTNKQCNDTIIQRTFVRCNHSYVQIAERHTGLVRDMNTDRYYAVYYECINTIDVDGQIITCEVTDLECNDFFFD